MKDNDRISVTKNDILESDCLAGLSTASLVAALVEIEFYHPGLLSLLVRLSALVADDWHITATSKSPERSLEVQEDLVQWMNEIERSLTEEGRRRLLVRGLIATKEGE